MLLDGHKPHVLEVTFANNRGHVRTVFKAEGIRNDADAMRAVFQMRDWLSDHELGGDLADAVVEPPPRAKP